VAQERSEAIVLRAVDFSETSRIVTFLTPARGRLACMAQGARRPRHKYAALLDTFNRLEVVYIWKGERGVQTLTDASLLEGFGRLKRDLDKSLYAAFPLELAYKAAHEDAPSEELYDCLAGGLHGLENWPGDAGMHACWTAMQMLRIAGYEPELTRCVLTGDALPDAPGFVYRGGATRRTSGVDARLSAASFQVLRELTSGAECPAGSLDRSIFDIIAAYAAHHLESDFRSARVIRAAL